MKILGIDPGSKITGYGLIDVNGNKIKHLDCGGIHISGKKPLHERLSQIYEEITKLLSDFQPDMASVEDVFVAKNAKSSLILGHVRGVILLAISNAGIPFSEHTPREVKKAITGTGTATKEQVQYMVKALLKLQEAPFEDASDALAIAICHSQTINLENRLKK